MTEQKLPIFDKHTLMVTQRKYPDSIEYGGIRNHGVKVKIYGDFNQPESFLNKKKNADWLIVEMGLKKGSESEPTKGKDFRRIGFEKKKEVEKTKKPVDVGFG